MKTARIGLKWLVGSVVWGWAAASLVASADTSYQEQWGPAVGTPVPMLEALDQDGQRRNFENLAGKRGLLLFFSRSTDW